MKNIETNFPAKRGGLLGLGEDDKPGGVGASVAGEDHVASGPKGLGFLN
jgi:hypothetical protein